jgi:hypothetical protein
MSHVADLGTFITTMEQSVVSNVTKLRPVTLPSTPCFYNRFRTARFDGSVIGIKKDITTVTAFLGVGIEEEDLLLNLVDDFIDVCDPILFANKNDALPHWVTEGKRTGWTEDVDTWGDTSLRVAIFSIEVEANEPIVP